MARSSTKKRSPSPSSSSSDDDDKNDTPKRKSASHKNHKKRKHGNAVLKQRLASKKRRTNTDDSSECESTSPSPSSSSNDNEDRSGIPKKKLAAHKIHKKRKYGNTAAKQRHVSKKRRTNRDDSSDYETTEEDVININGVTRAPAKLRKVVKAFQKWNSKVSGNAIRNWVDENNAVSGNPKYKINRKGIEAFKLWHQRMGERPIPSAFPDLPHPGGEFGGKTFDPEYTEDDENQPFGTRGRQDAGSGSNHVATRSSKRGA